MSIIEKHAKYSATRQQRNDHLMPTMLTWHPTSAEREDDDKELNGIEILHIKLNLELYASKLTTHLRY